MSNTKTITDFKKVAKAIDNNPARYIVPCNTKFTSDNKQTTYDIQFEQIESNPGNCYFDLITDDNISVYEDETSEPDETGTKYNVPCNAFISLANNSIMTKNNRSELCSLRISNIPISSKPSTTRRNDNNINFQDYTFIENRFITCPNNYTGFNQINDTITDKLMHNKFCIIDNDLVITGSYNWTFKARLNDENVIVNNDVLFFIDTVFYIHSSKI